MVIGSTNNHLPVAIFLYIGQRNTFYSLLHSSADKELTVFVVLPQQPQVSNSKFIEPFSIFCVDFVCTLL